MKFNTVATAISDYINQLGTKELIDAISYSAPSIQYFTIQSGVNEDTDIHLFETTGALMSGKGCDPSANNTTFTYTDRRLHPAYMKQESIDCVDTLMGKWMAWDARYGANSEEMPFGQKMIEGLQKNVAENLEKFIWNGATIGSETFKGIADIIADPSEGSKKIYVDPSTGNVYDMVVAAIKGADAKYRKSTEIFMSEDNLLALKEELLKRDFRLFDLTFSNGTEVDENTIKMPIYGTKVHGVSGLNGTNDKIYSLVPEHVIYGTSNDSDRTDILSMTNLENEKHTLRVKFIACVQIAYPTETAVVILGNEPTE